MKRSITRMELETMNQYLREFWTSYERYVLHLLESRGFALTFRYHQGLWKTRWYPLTRLQNGISLLIAYERIDTRLWPVLDVLAISNGMLMRHVATACAIASQSIY